MGNIITVILIVIAAVLTFFFGYSFGLYWHIKTAHRILNEGLNDGKSL